jgi:muramoyltetrapeptide carboxypeptidase
MENFDDFTRDSMLRVLSSTEPLGVIDNPEGIPPRCIVPGRCEGLLVGGNLSLIAALCGTPYQLNPEGKVLLLEDVDEYIYKLDSMLTQLRLAGMFEKCVGVVLGGFTNCTEEYERYALHLEDIIRDIIVPAGKPVLANMSIGHTPVKITVPLGVRCAVDAGAGTMTMIEAALEK